jgi:hypothetical protein
MTDLQEETRQAMGTATELATADEREMANQSVAGEEDPELMRTRPNLGSAAKD